MFGVANFLMRWLFLSNLVEDVAEIQTLPYAPLLDEINHHHHHHVHQQHQSHDFISEEEDDDTTQTQERQQQQQSGWDGSEQEWRDHCLRGILSYPPGTQRALIMDALRVELVQQLNQHLSEMDRVLEDIALRRDPERLNTDPGGGGGVAAVASPEEKDKQLQQEGGENTASKQQQQAMAWYRINQAYRTKREIREYIPQLVSAVLKSPPPISSSDTLQQPPLLNPINRLRELLLSRCIIDPSWGIELCWLLEAEVGRTWKSLFEHRQQTGKRLIIVLPADKATVLAKIGHEKREAFDLLQDVEHVTAYGNEFPVPIHDDVDQQQPQQPQPSSQHKLPSSLSLKRCSHFGDTMHFIDRLTKISLDLRRIPTPQRKDYLHEALHEMNRRLRRRMITRGEVSLDVDDHRGAYDWPRTEDLTVDMLKHSVHFPLLPSQAAYWPTGGGNNEHLGGVAHVLNIVVDEATILSSRERCPYLVHLEIADTGVDGNDARLYAIGSSTDLGVTLEEAMKTCSHVKQNYHDRGISPCEIPQELLMEQQQEEQQDKPSSSSSSSSSSPSPSFVSKSSLSSQQPLAPWGVTKKAATDGESTSSSSSSSETSGSASSEQNTATATPSVTSMSRGGSQIDDGEDEVFYHSTDPGNYHPHYDEGHAYDSIRQHEYEQLHHQMQLEQIAALQQQQQQQYEQQLQQQQNYQQQQPESSAPSDRPSIMGTLTRPTVTVGSDLLNMIYGRPWIDKCEEIRNVSPYGKVQGWRLASFIMKAGEDIRREALVMQIICKMRDWFEAEIPQVNRPYLRPYTIMCVGGDAGLVECLSDAKSVDEVKKKCDNFVSLRDYFERAYGPPKNLKNPNQNIYSSPPLSASAAASSSHHPQQQQQPHAHQQQYHHHQGGNSDEFGSITFEEAQDNFLRSLVGYSLVCFILQIKDRHNANILMDRAGHIMHIDFGFVLGDTPKMGKVPLFSERAPFKLSSEFWEVLGGWNLDNGGLGVRFCKMFERAFECAAAHSEEIAALVEATMLILSGNPRTARLNAKGVRSRLRMRGPPNSIEQKTFIMDLVNTALTSWGTSTYDWLQKNMNGYQ